MKKTILFVGLFAAVHAAGQNNDLLDIQKLIKERQAKDKAIDLNFHYRVPLRTALPQLHYEEAYILPNGDKVVYGQLDGMPIVQTDMRNFTIMPRVEPNYILPRSMPNGARGNVFNDLGATGPNHLMDQLAPSPVLDKLLRNHGK